MSVAGGPNHRVSDSQTRRAWDGPAFLSLGYRPFFLLGALYAGLAIPLWLLAILHGYRVGGDDPLGWHVHEMLFGYLAAIIAGFLLTAIPSWTGRLPVLGWPLAALVLLWLAGRVAMAIRIDTAAAFVDAGFLVCVACFAWREVVGGGSRRNIPVCVLVSLMALANILFHAGPSLGLPDGLGLRLGLGVAIMFLSLIGGRVIPSFTTNWMKKQKLEPLPAPFGRFDHLVLLLCVVALVLWIFAPDIVVTGIAMLLAGVAQLARLCRWRGIATLADPLVAVLHLAYLWLVVAILGLGAAIVWPAAITNSQALHALTAGAIGQMTLAVMTRASLGHGGQELKAGWATIAIYLLLFFGALLRVVLPSLPIPYSIGVTLAGSAWSAAMLLFVIAYGPLLVRRRA